MKIKIKRAVSGILYIILMWSMTTYSIYTFTFLFVFLAILSIYEMWKLRKGKSKLLSFSYIIIPFILVHLLILNNQQNEEFNSSIILFVYILTWVFDTFAYLFGINFGKNKILPSISPKKSWEGFIGGSVFVLITSYIIYPYYNDISISNIIAITILLPFTSSIGDFIASYYKRQAKVKDSGKMIPGHGGIIDRLDSFMITIPCIYLINIIF